jgi:hypothetical protein
MILKRNPNVTEKQVTRHGDFQVATAKGKGDGFLSWAKMGMIQGDCPLSEPGDPVWFDFGKTREQARANVLAQVGLSA